MLVLTRRVNEGVVIGDPKNPIGRIVVCQIKGGSVKIGFDFVKDLEIVRTEVLERMRNAVD